MKEVLSILNEISEVSGTKAKKEIIRANKGNPLFLKTVKYALDQGRSFNLTWLPYPETTNGASIFDYLDYLSGKRGATAREAMTLASRCTSDEAREVVTRIINKDLRCGAKSKTFNSVVPGLVYQVPYQRYRPFSAIHDVDFENDNVIAQLKLDGLFSYFIPDESRFISRQGNSFSLTEDIVIEAQNGWMHEAAYIASHTLVWSGEVLVEVNGKYLPRKTGNGIINKFISGDGDPDYADKLVYVTWGFITKTDYENRESEDTYERNLDIMEKARDKCGLGNRIRMNPTTQVRTLQEALTFYKRVRERQEEGAMVKVVNKLVWKDQQSGTPYGVKLKAEVDSEFEIVDAYQGVIGKKYEHMLGGLTIRTSCGGLVTNVGSGFSDQERELGVDFWRSKIGKIVTVRYTGVITNKTDRATECLDLPRFVETRFNEKEEADTLEYCKEELKNA